MNEYIKYVDFPQIPEEILPTPQEKQNGEM